MAFMFELPGKNVPLPEELHMAPVEIAKEPVRLTETEFEQRVLSVPALTLGAVEIVTVICFETGAHPPLLPELNISVTVPAAMSAEEGM